MWREGWFDGFLEPFRWLCCLRGRTEAPLLEPFHEGAQGSQVNLFDAIVLTALRQ